MASHIPGYRMRSACDACHLSKLRCSGGSPCANCQLSDQPCAYSPSNRLGRPKGIKNKPTVDNSARTTSTRSSLKETTLKRPVADSHNLPTMDDLDRLVHANYPVLSDELDHFTV
ncbi:hypothetical protein N7510_002639 [Penicillium lagena]|uniref:uncharacterized protein n=1 Tax=Penicillium lagena TaxID=94218 RepID=UPI002541314D|nr:uncharacterized protein N7510_002639 [Penicillium lagena]KAJ5626330.1 hypothetical protein N7510_002639 [Penicillium lagena]